MQPPYDYKECPLLNPASIRLLVLQSSPFDDPIHCSLEELDEGDERDYDALSYAWEGQEPSVPISIISKDQHRYDLDVIPNLLDALRQLRHADKDRFFWIDAICINQNDKEEKNNQIPKMAQIYSEASNVRVWLGKEMLGKSQVAIGFIHKILDFENFDSLIEDGRLVKEWAALMSLMKSGWFSRRWVVQEVALAKKAFIHCGDDSVAWDKFADAVRLFEERGETIQRHFTEAPGLGYRSDLVTDIMAMNATRLVHATSNLFRKSDDGVIIEWLVNLETLVSDLTPFEASDPKDTIYGVLALAKDAKGKRVVRRVRHSPTATAENDTSRTSEPSDTNNTSNTRGKRRAQSPAPNSPGSKSARNGTSKSPSTRRQSTNGQDPLPNEQYTDREKALIRWVIKKLKRRADSIYEVNYKRDYFTICREFLKFVITRSGNLDMLCRPWAPPLPTPKKGEKAEAPLPSWISTLSNQGFSKRHDGSYSRLNADPLVGGPGNGKQNYSASKAWRAVYHFGDLWKHEGSRTLRVKGFVLDTIKATTRHPAMSGDIPVAWPQFAGWKDRTADPPKAFWTTLIAGRGPNGLNPPEHYIRACKYAFSKAEGGPLDVHYLTGHPGFNSVAKEYLKRMQSVVWMRRLMKSKERGLLGLVPDEAEEGDKICILFGCSVPVVLREVEESHNESRFKFIGECYVHGFMDGEAMPKVKAESYQHFVLM